MLYVEQSVYNPTTNLLNSQTSWYWNIRIGDKIQLNNMGIWYTIVGPMNIYNPELFVNVGDPGDASPPEDAERHELQPGVPLSGQRRGRQQGRLRGQRLGRRRQRWRWIVDQVIPGVNPLGEWVEVLETWQGAALNNVNNIPYTITRRPVVSPGSRETPLPSNVVVDLTTWNAQYFNVNFSTTTGINYVSERSRLPVDPTTGYVDILLNPNGTVVPTTVYSSPTSFGMGSSFYHFWLAERGDLYDPVATPGVAYLLPQVQNVDTPAGETRFLKGERRLLTLFTRTGAINTNQVETFDGNNPSLPFLAPQQGIRGTHDEDPNRRRHAPFRGHHAHRDLDLDPDPGRRPGLAGHALSDRPAAPP